MHALCVSSVTHPPSCLRSLFTLARMKRAQFGPHDWLSLPVPPGPNWLLVDALEPETAYQFSVLAQNRLGTSAFSEVVTVNTLGEAPRRGAEGVSRRSWVGQGPAWSGRWQEGSRKLPLSCLLRAFCGPVTRSPGKDWSLHFVGLVCIKTTPLPRPSHLVDSCCVLSWTEEALNLSFLVRARVRIFLWLHGSGDWESFLLLYSGRHVPLAPASFGGKHVAGPAFPGSVATPPT